MSEPRLFVCSGAHANLDSAENANRHVVNLDALGSEPNVTIRIQDVARVFLREMAPRLVDLLELAAYVFAADSKTRRGQLWQDDAVEPWGRDFRFILPVRDLEFWNRPDVITSLTSTLNFLSGDRFSFSFSRQEERREAQGYLDLGDTQWAASRTERVILFSGGLDSLAGAVETAAAGLPLVLVSHRPVSQISSRQRKLVAALRATFPSVPILHVPVWVNKSEKFHNEPTQRTRSFLFSALGFAVAEMVSAGGIRFFENGVVSLNLPVADEAIRARSSRTTHPLAIKHLGAFISLVAGRDVAVENPFIYKTKADVISTIAAHGAASLIGLSVSCAHTMFKSKTQQHCGTCSQCIDRRISVLAAGLEEYDPGTDYVSDVFTGPRKDDYERNIAIHYARHATELFRMSEDQFAGTFNLDLSRAIRALPASDQAGESLYDLHQRHSAGVTRVLATQLGAHSEQIVARELPPTSMLGLIAGQKHETSMWDSYADRLAAVLQLGLPKACASHKPKTEPHLQEIANGILAGYDENLVREFPFMRWSASATKPDWSQDALSLWVELKYVRSKKDIRPITKDIAEDITKYGDNLRRVLFVIYDPTHSIADDSAFAAPIVSRKSMRVSFIR